MKHWCANFEHEECLRHGLAGGFWMMHYQYTDADEGNRRSRITMNYRQLESVQAGDLMVAYLPTNTFYATGKVMSPKRAATSADTHDTIDAYLQRHEAFDTGFVYYTDTVAYENHTDPWRHPNPDWNAAYPVRIDVVEWEYRVQAGVEVKVINEISLPQRQLAIFELTEEQYNRIVKGLRTE
ncbi:MAG: hypothetical protein K2P78_13195 [Gemmataceae bacterium]|nr:hypothetical protein [Gemmataceae bacterium]